MATRTSSLLREKSAHGHHKVTFVELFFDLVFVFAVTQLSHSLIHHFNGVGAAQTALLTLAVWWAWIYTSWVTNWLDPDRPPVRLLLLALMLIGLILSAALPQAFEARGAAFAGAYVALQLGRTLFVIRAVRDHPGLRRNFQRIGAWLAAGAIGWIAGALHEGETRLACWTAALAVEYLSPAVGFWTPGLGRSTTRDWDVEGGHMAERCALFIIIALGESILVTGATFADLEWTPAGVAAFVASLVGSIAMWWLYFDASMETGSRIISTSGDPGRLARVAYTYVHLLLVAGIILGAVADEFVLAHPAGHAEPRTALATLGSSALYLLGTALFKRALTGRLPASPFVGLAALGAAALAARHLNSLALSAIATLVLVASAAWEGYARRGCPPEAGGK
jgi:low temperature requirement protein LtrA